MWTKEVDRWIPFGAGPFYWYVAWIWFVSFLDY
jgi:hypothetical protein